MELPIAPTTHVPTRDQIVRAWLRALEMVGGSTDGLVSLDTHQRVSTSADRGAPLHDAAFGFAGHVRQAELANLLQEGVLPRRVIPDAGWDQAQVDQGLSPLGYKCSPLDLWVLSRTSIAHAPEGGFQVLSGRAVYRDVAALDPDSKIGLTLLLDEPRLDMLVLRLPQGPVSAVSVITVNTLGLIVDFTMPDPGIPGLAQATLWYALELCSRSQHKAVAAVLSPSKALIEPFKTAGFMALPPFPVWELA